MTGIVESLKELEEKVDRFINAKTIVIFGASSGGRKALEILRLLNRRPSFFTDNDQKKWGTEIDGVRVIPPEELKRIDPDAIVIGSTVYEDEMVEQVSRYGLCDRIVLLGFLELLVIGKFLFELFEKLRKAFS